MWKQQLLQIFVIIHPHPLPSIYPSPHHEIPLIYYIKRMGIFLAISDRSSKMNILLGYSQVHHKYSLPLLIIQFSSLPYLTVLGYVLILRLSFGPQAQPFPHAQYLWNQLVPKIALKILLFNSSGEKEDFDILVLLPLQPCFVRSNHNNTCLLF